MLYMEMHQAMNTLNIPQLFGVPDEIRTHGLKIRNLKVASFTKVNNCVISYMLISVQVFATLINNDLIILIYTKKVAPK